MRRERLKQIQAEVSIVRRLLMEYHVLQSVVGQQPVGFYFVWMIG